MSDLRSKLSRTAEDFEPSTDWLDAVLGRAHRRRRNRRVGAGLVSLAVFGAAFAGVWIGFSGGSSQPAAAPCTPEVIDVSGPALPSDASMTAAAAVSPDDAWAVGPADRGEVPVGGRVVVWHWNGESWEVVPSPSPETGPQATDTLVAVAALGPGDAWAVGEADPQQGLPRTEAARVIVEHWDGTAWSVVDAPSPSSFESGLTGVAAIAADDVWAVGFEVEGTIAKPLAEHWDGRRWSIAETPEVTRGDGNGAVLEAVTALAADDAWAVGSTAANPLIEHWDGSSWSVVEAPGLPAGTADGLLRAVAASGPDEVWAVGWASSRLLGHGLPLAFHWDGSSWQDVSPVSAGDGVDTLAGVAIGSSGEVWAVGGHREASPMGGFWTALVEHWTGSAWEVVPTPAGSGRSELLYGAAAVPGDGVWLFGRSGGTFDNEGTLLGAEPLVLRGSCAR